MNRFPNQGLEKAMEVKGRKVGHARKTRQGQRFVQVLGDVVEHPMDALGVDLLRGFRLHAVTPADGLRTLDSPEGIGKRVAKRMRRSPAQTLKIRRTLSRNSSRASSTACISV